MSLVGACPVRLVLACTLFVFLLASDFIILYNQISMLLTPATMRLLLVLCLVGMAGLAILFLRSRKLTRLACLSWLLMVCLLPALGPFLVILLRPGRSSCRPPSRVRLIWGRTQM